MQQITIIGNLGREPEMNVTPDGTPYSRFSVAVDKWNPKTNKNDAQWFNVVTWNKTAERCNDYLHKGSMVCCIGRMNDPRPYMDKQGNPKANLELTADKVEFLARFGKDNGSEYQGPGDPPQPQDNGEEFP